VGIVEDVPSEKNPKKSVVRSVVELGNDPST
jgi:hypothetical protein